MESHKNHVPVTTNQKWNDELFLTGVGNCPILGILDITL